MRARNLLCKHPWWMTLNVAQWIRFSCFSRRRSAEISRLCLSEGVAANASRITSICWDVNILAFAGINICKSKSFGHACVCFCDEFAFITSESLGLKPIHLFCHTSMSHAHMTLSLRKKTKTKLCKHYSVCPCMRWHLLFDCNALFNH